MYNVKYLYRYLYSFNDSILVRNITRLFLSLFYPPLHTAQYQSTVPWTNGPIGQNARSRVA